MIRVWICEKCGLEKDKQDCAPSRGCRQELIVETDKRGNSMEYVKYQSHKWKMIQKERVELPPRLINGEYDV